MKKSALVIGIVIALIGGLWFFQGLGLVKIEPLFCVANCEPLRGPSASWAVAGVCALALGFLLVVFGLSRQRN